MAHKSSHGRTPTEEAAHEERQKAKAEARTRAALAPVDKNKRYEVETSIKILGCSRATIYAHIRNARLRTIKEGRRTYITGASLIEMSCPSAQP